MTFPRPFIFPRVLISPLFFTKRCLEKVYVDFEGLRFYVLLDPFTPPSDYTDRPLLPSLPDSRLPNLESSRLYPGSLPFLVSVVVCQSDPDPKSRGPRFFSLPLLCYETDEDPLFLGPTFVDRKVRPRNPSRLIFDGFRTRTSGTFPSPGFRKAKVYRNRTGGTPLSDRRLPTCRPVLGSYSSRPSVKDGLGSGPRFKYLKGFRSLLPSIRCSTTS